jgi:hypothetical protein
MGNKDGKRSLRQRLQDFISTVNGQIVINYAYNWGASVVILGALFKLIHLPGANAMLCIGMGTEVFIFFISAFDLSGIKRDNGAGGTIVINGAVSDEPINISASADSQPQRLSAGQQSEVSATQANTGGCAPVTITPEMEQATSDYLEKLRAMTAALERCTTQAQGMVNDSEQMATLGKNLAGINAIYEMQLRSASSQIGNIDLVNEQIRRMANQIEELNNVYARMLQAMTPNR